MPPDSWRPLHVQSAELSKFDLIVGKLEEIIMEASFTQRLNDFCRENCQQFDDVRP